MARTKKTDDEKAFIENELSAMGPGKGARK